MARVSAPPAGAAVSEAHPLHVEARVRADRINDAHSRELILLGGSEASGVSVVSDGERSVAFEGRLYNRGELSAGRGPLAAETDAEIVLAAYRRLGAELLPRLRGDFALVIADGLEGQTLAVRDPIGVHPLFYAETDGIALFSSSLDALVQDPRVSNRLNRAALADHLFHRWPDYEETFYADVKRVPPGHAVRLAAGDRTTYRYWHPAPPGEKLSWMSSTEVGRFDELFERAVQRGLELGRAGIYLSGGLDSVSVAAVAADLSRKSGGTDPLALSLIFPDPRANEEKEQRAVAGQLGIPQALATFDDALGTDGLLARALELSAALPAPLMNPWAPAYEHLSRTAAENGCRVILTGSGGDEWLGVTPVLAADLIRRGDLVGFIRLWQAFQGSYELSRPAALRILAWRFGLHPLFRGAWAKAARAVAPERVEANRLRRIEAALPDWIAPDPRFRKELLERTHGSRAKRKSSSFYLHEGDMSLDHALVSMELEEFFESGRRSGVPILMPFWDADLIDFLFHVPPRLLNRGNRTKGLVRDTLARRFPDLRYERHRKVLATGIFRNTMIEQGRHHWKRMGGAAALAEIGVVEPTLTDSTIGQVLDGEQPGYAYRVWDILSLEAWLRPRL